MKIVAFFCPALVLFPFRFGLFRVTSRGVPRRKSARFTRLFNNSKVKQVKREETRWEIEI